MQKNISVTTVKKGNKSHVKNRDSVFNFEKSEVNPIYKDENKLFVNFFRNSIRGRNVQNVIMIEDWAFDWLRERSILNCALHSTLQIVIALTLCPMALAVTYLIGLVSFDIYTSFRANTIQYVVKSRVH